MKNTTERDWNVIIVFFFFNNKSNKYWIVRRKINFVGMKRCDREYSRREVCEFWI